MAKNKSQAKKKRTNADLVRNRKKTSTAEKKVNPFEVKINRQKHQVVGRKITKNEMGMPGLSRKKANLKREQTLLQEYDKRLKSNKFLDKRFGEYDTNLSLEDKMAKRFAMVRAGEKSRKFNLNDEDEDLTHFGQSLAEIEKFEDPLISDDDEEDAQGKITGDIVQREHFGGFLSDSNYEPLGGDKRTWKERMEEIIVNSKKAKHERQMEKEKSQELTEKLDSEFRDLMQHITASSKREEEEPNKPDDYDMTVRELKFEATGQATNKLKTEEELAMEEKQRLENLEADRIKRMRGEIEEEPSSTHRSADDLDDGFALDNKGGGFYVSYKDGKLINPPSQSYSKNNQDEDEEDEDEDTDENNEDNESMESDSDDEEDKKDGEEKEDGEDDDDDDDDGGDDSSSGEDSYDDIQSDAESDTQTETAVSKNKGQKLNLKERKKVMEEARKEVPYTFKIPENYDDLIDLLQSYSEADQITVIERVCKCHHPSLAEGNKDKIQVFFSLLVQYYGDLALQEPPRLQLMDRLTTPLYHMANQSPLSAGQALLDQIKERQDEFRLICSKKAGRGLYPALDTLLLLKLVSLLFPTSDFCHPVTTPSFLFMTQMLAQCPVNHERDVAAGLFVCNLCLEFVSLSKRYVSEAINFLHGVLFLAAEKDKNKLESVVPPFKPVGDKINLLKVTKKQKKTSLQKFRMSEVLSLDMEIKNPHDFRLSAIYHCVFLLQEFSLLYKELASYKEIFSPVRCMCGKLPTETYPEELKVEIHDLVEGIKQRSSETLHPIVMKSAKPQALKMFEPMVEEVLLDRKGKKRKGVSKEKHENQKLLHKYKKEMKGAIREIRLDNKFIARKKLQKTIEDDRQREKKVKAIQGMLASQEGDFNFKKNQKISMF